MKITGPLHRLRWGVALILLVAPPSWAAPESSPPPDYRAPNTEQLCPAIYEDYDLCSDDLMSRNCADFVEAAGHLGTIYRSELSAHPGWIEGLQNSIWWGCGSLHLVELRSLLRRIDTERARSVLAQEPYRSLSEPPAPAPRRVPHQQTNCLAPATQAERDACAAGELDRLKAEHERVYVACEKRVAPALRTELVDAEKSWKNLLPVTCQGPAYTRDECLARAYQERTESIRAMHPECAAAP